MNSEQNFLRNSKEWPSCNIGVRRRNSNGSAVAGHGFVRGYDPLTVIVATRRNLTYKTTEELLQYWAITQH